jgi:hypothetical protein
MATVQQKSSRFLHLARTESATAMKHAFNTEFHVEPTSRVFIYAQCKTFDQKGRIFKAKVLFLLLCSIQLQTVFGRASKAAEVFAFDIVCKNT